MFKLPQIDHRHKVCVICEGDEDFAYFKRLKELSVWNEIYEFVPQNAHGESKIASMYASIYQNDNYEIVLILCDTDRAPQTQYQLLKKKLIEFHGGDKRLRIDKFVIFAIPCTMQIILSHFGDVSLRSQGKKTNADVIERYTGIIGYDAHQEQIRELCGKIYQRSYSEMKRRIALINNPDTELGSTNFIVFLQLFESDNVKWISDTRSYLDKKKS